MPREKNKSAYRGEYVARLNRVMDYVQEHLDGDLSLEALAKVACFSPYHFHRIFSAMLGETCNQFTRRVRLERAASKLLTNKEQSITEVALDCGFGSLETFARAFRERFGMTAGQWRAGESLESKNHQTLSKQGKPLRNRWQDVELGSLHHDPHTNTISWRLMMKTEDGTIAEAKIEVKEMPALHVAYVRHVGPYKGDEQLFAGLFGRLMAWAGPRGLLGQPDVKMLSVYHDDPNLTEEEKLRVSVCISCPPDTEVSGEIGKMELPGGQFAVGHFEIQASEYTAAWNTMYGAWLPSSGFQPNEGAPYELCLNNPSEHPEGKHIVDICVPVKAL